jgi:serine/threonine protein kinase
MYGTETLPMTFAATPRPDAIPEGALSRLRRQVRAPGRTAVLPGYADAVEIGGGAFATVYRATETDTGRQVALKVLKLDSVNDRLREAFSQEIQALGQVSHHPNIVTLYRPAVTPDGRPVFVLELCRGSLSE